VEERSQNDQYSREILWHISIKSNSYIKVVYQASSPAQSCASQRFAAIISDVEGNSAYPAVVRKNPSHASTMFQMKQNNQRSDTLRHASSASMMSTQQFDVVGNELMPIATSTRRMSAVRGRHRSIAGCSMANPLNAHLNAIAMRLPR
jgi:hypothetical protein